MLRFAIFLFVIAAAASNREEQKTIAVDFTEEVNVERLTGESYLGFIKHLRSRLAASYSRGVAVLPVLNEADPRGFDLKLRCGRRETTVRIHRDSLNLRGYQMQSPQKWLEFGRRAEQPPQLIERSELLEFDGSYSEMESAAQQRVTDLSFDKNALRDAIGMLAVSTDTQERARSLMVVNQMIIEAIRFVDVANYFASKLESAQSVRLPRWMQSDLVNNWERFSYMVVKSDADPCFEFRPPMVHGKMIETVEELRGIMGIMMRDPETLKPPCSPTVYRHAIKVLDRIARKYGPGLVLGRP